MCDARPPELKRVPTTESVDQGTIDRRPKPLSQILGQLSACLAMCRRLPIGSRSAFPSHLVRGPSTRSGWAVKPKADLAVA